jgi:hypothetical protein
MRWGRRRRRQWNEVGVGHRRGDGRDIRVGRSGGGEYRRGDAREKRVGLDRVGHRKGDGKRKDWDVVRRGHRR